MKYDAFWEPDDFYAPDLENGHDIVDETFFTTDVCYKHDEISDIRALNVGETWVSPDYGYSHTVTRIE